MRPVCLKPVDSRRSCSRSLRCFIACACCGILAGCGAAEPPRPDGRPTPKPQSQVKKNGKRRPQPQPKVETELAEEPRPTGPQTVEEPQASKIQAIHRPNDTRLKRDDVKLTERGFVKVSSQRIILYSDLPAQELNGLSEGVDQLYPALEAYFGPLPPDRAGTPYQMTGYLMSDVERFRAAGILSEGPAQSHEGWYLGNEFWWNRQATPYYTRHLMLHEATHCFMHVMPSVDCPPWYVEGMAELFGTHSRDEQGKYLFGIFPSSSDQSPGWSRVNVLQDEIAAGKLADADQILAFKFDDYARLPPYAWSWAFCHFLNNHPRYQVPFRKLAKGMMSGGFAAQATELFQPLLADIRDEWLLFASQIQYAHDIERSAIEFQPGLELAAPGKSSAMEILAARGWQSSRVSLIAGRKYRVRATGRVTLATTTKPWISEPQGISIRYFAGQPLGRLMGTIRPEPTGDATNRDILKLIPLGPNTTFVATHTGTFYLRLNDAWNELADNAGDVQAEIELLAD
ncbi:MAG: hypothetical protein V4719_16485 [Planctomycetota bacterium]